MRRRVYVIQLGLIGALVLCCGMPAPGGPVRSCSADEAAFAVLESTEVAGETEAGAAELSAEDVEEARKVTRERLYGLGGLWLLIVVVIVLIRLQVCDDERLLHEGYYPAQEE